jgi:hypothetical protein
MSQNSAPAQADVVDREQAVTRAFVSIATALVGDEDVADLATTLTGACAQMLGVASAGLLLVDSEGVLGLAAASSQDTRSLGLFALQCEQGPCLECFDEGVPVSIADLAPERQRWPIFVPNALAAGFVSVHALPMRLRGERLGTLGLFGRTAGALSDADLVLGQALADVASVALVADRTTTDQSRITAQLQTALDSRVVIEQAKGQLAQLAGLDMEDAFRLLRGYARDRNERLSEVARQLVAREIAGAQLVEHARTKTARLAR